MESSLCLRYGPQPTLPLRIPSPVKPTRLTKPHKSFTLSSLPLTNTNNLIYRPPRHGSSLVCAINGFPKPSTNDGCWEIIPPSKGVRHQSENCPNSRDDGKKIVRGSVGASLALACVLGIISCGSTMMSPIAIAIVKNQKSQITTTIYPKGGRVALKSLLDMSVYLSSSQGKPKRYGSFSTSYKSSKKPSTADVETVIKEAAMQQLKLGKGDEAVKVLQKAYKDCNGDPEPEFNVEMALVEVLICLGRYEEASKYNCLNQRVGPSDARAPLYKAIIFTMLDQKEPAKTWWKEYIKAVEGGGIPDPQGLPD